MNAALDRFADNPIIDELVFWPPKSQAIERVRACNVLFRKPFIEVRMQGGEVFQRHFERHDFTRYWAEACVILNTLTAIELHAEFDCSPPRNAKALAQTALDTRDSCIAESDKMFAEGMYEQYLMQFGLDYKNLPAATELKLEQARRALDAAG